MSIRIGLSATGLPFDGPAGLSEWLNLCEHSAIDSVWLSDRLVSVAPALESIATLAYVAGQTKRLKFGMNAVVLPFRDPLVLAKECATIDYLSGGRLLPVFGVGNDNAPEWPATNRTPQGRGAQSDEMLTILSRLWSEEQVTFEGKHYQYHNVTISPRPVQSPLPIWIGGSSPAAVRRTATLGTGWLAGLQTPAQVAPVVKKIRVASFDAGRPLDEDHYGAGFAFRFGSWEEPLVQRTADSYSRLGRSADPQGLLAVGKADDIVERAREYVDAGISKFVLRAVAASQTELMHQTERLIEEVVPRVHSS